jgi:hypothetical protein
MAQLSPESATEKIKERAAGFGSTLHSAIQTFLNGDTPDLTAESAEMQQAFMNFKKWWETAGLTAHAVEQRVWSLDGYGGTVDLYAHDEAGRLWCIDWKSGRSLHDTHALQISSYANASPEPVYGGMLVRIPRGPRAKVEVRSYTAEELKKHYGIFKCCLATWRWQREMAGLDAGDGPLPGGSH